MRTIGMLFTPIRPFRPVPHHPSHKRRGCATRAASLTRPNTANNVLKEELGPIYLGTPTFAGRTTSSKRLRPLPLLSLLCRACVDSTSHAGICSIPSQSSTHTASDSETHAASSITLYDGHSILLLKCKHTGSAPMSRLAHWVVRRTL